MRTLATTGGGKKSLAFDGSTGRATTLFVPSGSCSVSVWANLTDNAAAYCLWGTALVGGFTALLRVETNGLVTFSASTAAAAVSWPAGTAGAPGTWMHYVLTYDIAHAILYTNGVSQGSNPYSTAWNGGALEFGARGVSSNPFRGYIYRMMVWDQYILTAGDVTTLQNGGLSVARSNLAVEYLLKEGSGGRLRDTSGKGNDGTLVGGASWAPLAPAA